LDESTAFAVLFVCTSYTFNLNHSIQRLFQKNLQRFLFTYCTNPLYFLLFYSYYSYTSTTVELLYE